MAKTLRIVRTWAQYTSARHLRPGETACACRRWTLFQCVPRAVGVRLGVRHQRIPFFRHA